MTFSLVGHDQVVRTAFWTFMHSCVGSKCVCDVAGGVMVGTMYRRFANGTCFSYSDLACTTLQDGYLQVSLTSLCTHAGVATTFQSCFLSVQPCGENSYLGLHGGLCVWAVG